MRAPAIDGRTKVAALLGDPVAHSLSPAILNVAFASAGVQAVYVALPVAPSDLGTAVRALAAAGSLGANVTAPHKRRVVRYADAISAEVRATGAANTLSFRAGRVRADATDGAGFFRFLEAEGIAVRGRRVVIAGTGGAARSLLYVLARTGAVLGVITRRPRAARRALLPVLAPHLPRAARVRGVAIEIAARSSRAAADLLSRADLAVNATPLGAHPGDPLPFDPRALPPAAAVVDLLYAPPRTRLLDAAVRRGLRARNGLGLLVHQACLSFEIWTGLPAPVNVMVKEAMRHALPADRSRRRRARRT